jgi:RimJ/RimL family protein N-acetyltransferase
MSKTTLQTERLKLIASTLEETRARLAQLDAAQRAEVSPVWLARLETTTEADAIWTFGFAVLDRTTDAVVGQCAFKGPPDAEKAVEIAYGVAPEHQNRGYATEAANALVAFAFGSGKVRIVRAHTLRERNASTRVLTKCGFEHMGEVIDPEDGPVWRWEKRNGAV